MSRTRRHPTVCVAALESRRLLSAAIVADLSPSGAGPQSVVSNGGSIAYFTAKTAASGRELWRTDGTAGGTRLIVDLAPGSADANPTHLTIAGRYAYFSIDAVGGLRAGLYRSDGTGKGTIRLRDLNDADDFRGAADVGKNSVTFGLRAADDSWGLWRSDGTAKGTSALVKGGLPEFSATASDAVGNPTTGAYLSLGDDTTQTPVFSDGTAKGTRRIDVDAKRYSLPASAGKTMYLVAEFDKSYKVYDLDGAGKPQPIQEAVGLGFGSDASADYAFGITYDKTGSGTFARYDGAKIQTYAYYTYNGKRAAIPYDADNLFLGGRGSQGVLVDARGDDAGIWLTRDGDHSLRRVGVAPIYTVYGAVPLGDSAYVLGTAVSGDYQLARIDEATGKSSSVLDSRFMPDGFDKADGNPILDVNGRLILCFADSTGANDLYAVDVKTHRPERLTTGPGSPKDSIVYAHASDAAGRTIVLSGHAENATASIDLIDAAGNVRNLHVDRADDVGSANASFNDPTASINGTTAYVSYSIPVEGGNHTYVYGIDLNAGAVESLHKESAEGELRATTAGGRVYFDQDGQLRTSAGTNASGRTIGKSAPSIVNAFAVGERLVYTSYKGLYGASPDGAAVETLVATNATPDDSIGDVVVAGAYAYAVRGGTLYRTDGTAAGTTAIAASRLPAGQGEITSAIASRDGLSIYAVFSGAYGQPWSIVRLAADGSTGPATTLVTQPSTWTGGDPTLLAAGGDDVALGTGDFFASGSNASDAARAVTYALRVSRGTIAKIAYAGSGFDPRQVVASDDGVLLTSLGSDHAVVRLKAGGLRPLDGLTNADLTLTYDNGSAYAAKSTKETGKELFRYRLDTTLVGTIYGDLNANQSRDSDEHGLAGWRVYVDRNDNGRYDKGEPNVLTDSTGRFEFFELDPGTYKLRISTGPKYAMTTGTAYAVKLTAGQSVTKKFGARPIA